MQLVDANSVKLVVLAPAQITFYLDLIAVLNFAIANLPTVAVIEKVTVLLMITATYRDFFVVDNCSCLKSLARRLV